MFLKQYKSIVVFGAASVLLLGSFFFVLNRESVEDREEKQDAQELESQSALQWPEFEYDEFRLQSGQSFSDALRVAGVEDATARQFISLLSKHVDFRSLRTGQEFGLSWDRMGSSSLAQALRFKASDTKRFVVRRNGAGAWFLEEKELPVSVRLLNFSGEVASSLWNSALEAQMDPVLIAELTEIFAWQLDFARELREGDLWRLTVEQKVIDGKASSWGRIIAAQYLSRAREETFTAALFRGEDKEHGYFDEEGESLRKMFLRSPVRYSRISSRFSRRRFHPVLKRYRPHRGVDYAAPTGTPVRAVGDGVVVLAARKGGAGKMITIRHNSVYTTRYMHLHGYARGIRRGRKVSQGQVIGYVGSTGLSTGPHLHFEFWENGRYVDPLGRKFPSADPVPKDKMPEFVAKSKIQLESLPDWRQAARKPAGLKLVSHELTERINREALGNNSSPLQEL